LGERKGSVWGGVLRRKEGFNVRQTLTKEGEFFPHKNGLRMQIRGPKKQTSCDVFRKKTEKSLQKENLVGGGPSICIFGGRGSST